MADIQLDVASANRFISSLSKSLQALCHGCMDFDAGIEIVGYLNINIDSGSKVDYVLNEKVLKSTTNSMTFVSNSFLAKKEQPKTSKDGSCSPIPELNYPQHRAHGNNSYPAAQLYRSSGIYSPHSQVVRGSQKRQWPGGDWRMSPRKFSRGAKSQYSSSSYQQHQQSSSSQNESYPTSYSNQMSNSSFASPAVSSQQEYDSASASAGTESQSDVNIKKEVEESVGGDGADQTNGADSENVNIKADPDAATNQDSAENITAKSETDISNSFLQDPNQTDSTLRDPSNTGENQDNSVRNYEDTSYAESANAGDGGEDSNAGSGSQAPSGADADYEGTGEFFPESYSGEGTSGGGGQFEVIEIDDEDEDVAAMFDESRQGSGRKRNHPHSSTKGVQQDLLSSATGQITYEESTVYSDNSNLMTFSCEECNIPSLSMKDHQKHMNRFHRESMALPHICGQCHMGFYSKMGLSEHQLKHKGLVYPCSFCPSKFNIKRGLKRHMERVHQVRECLYCSVTYNLSAVVSHVCGRAPDHKI